MLKSGRSATTEVSNLSVTTDKLTNKQELNSKTIADGLKVNPWGTSPTALTSEFSRCCISTTNEKHTKHELPARPAATSSREMNCSREATEFFAPHY